MGVRYIQERKEWDRGNHVLSASAAAPGPWVHGRRDVRSETLWGLGADGLATGHTHLEGTAVS
jgi:hypothetical protein